MVWTIMAFWNSIAYMSYTSAAIVYSDHQLILNNMQPGEQKLPRENSPKSFQNETWMKQAWVGSFDGQAGGSIDQETKTSRALF